MTGSINNATYHAVQRSTERYGGPMTQFEADSIVMDITDTILGLRRCALFISHDGDDRERWICRFRDKNVALIYCPDNAMIVTVLRK